MKRRGTGEPVAMKRRQRLMAHNRLRYDSLLAYAWKHAHAALNATIATNITATLLCARAKDVIITQNAAATAYSS